VQAWAGDEHGSALVSRPYSKDLTHPAFAKRALLEQVPCSKLTLPNEGLFLPTATGTQALFVPGVEHWLDLAPGTELHSQPGKAAQGRVIAHSVARLGQQGDWIRVRSYHRPAISARQGAAGLGARSARFRVSCLLAGQLKRKGYSFGARFRRAPQTDSTTISSPFRPKYT
jgi:hypothetical protein